MVAAHELGQVITVLNTELKSIEVIRVADNPIGVAAAPDGTSVFISRIKTNLVSVFDVGDEPPFLTWRSDIQVGEHPHGMTFDPLGETLYVTNEGSDTLSIVSVSMGLQTNEVLVGERPIDVAVTSDGGVAFVTNGDSDSISIIDTSTLPR